MNIIIVDDEKIAIDVLSMMLKRLVQFNITIRGTFTNAEDAILFIEKEEEAVDVMFLDIEMIDMHGLDVAKQIQNKRPFLQIIFVTAHSQFALDAFEVEASDYLLKPVHEKRLMKALSKSQKKLDLEIETKNKTKENKLYVHIFGSFYLLDSKHEVVKWRTKKVRELFLYLWINQKKPVSNVIVIEELWPNLEFERATNNLHTSIYQIRKLLKENGIKNPIQLINNQYQLNIEIDSDYEELNQLLERVNHDEISIQQLLNCYEGDFLVEEEYLWAIQIRIHLRERVIQVLENYIDNNNTDNSLLVYNCLQKLLELDEFNEHFMFLLLEFLIRKNKKQKCLECYTSIQEKLAEIDMLVPEEIQSMFNDYILRV